MIILSSSTNRTLPELSKPIPESGLIDINGRDISSSDFRGGPVIGYSWLTTCAPCVKELLLLRKYYEMLLIDAEGVLCLQHTGELSENLLRIYSN